MSLSFQPSFGQSTDLKCHGPFFSLSLITPDNNAQRVEWAKIVQEALETICIEVKNHDVLGWTEFAQRTWDYPLQDTESDIPSYSDGGYDLAFIGIIAGDDPPSADLTSYYQSDSLPYHGGFNFYQYSNQTFDFYNTEYTTDINPITRTASAHKLQQIIYQDLPAIDLLYPTVLYAFNRDLDYLDRQYLHLLYTGELGDHWFDFGLSGQIVLWAHPNLETDYSPITQWHSFSRIYQNTIWQGLFARNATTKFYEPLLAQSMPVVSDGGLNFTVLLNEQVYFADGHALNATDVYDSFLRHLMPQYQPTARHDSFSHYFGNPFANPEDDSFRELDQIIQVQGPYSLSFLLINPYFDVYSLLSFPILPSHVWGHYDEPILGRGDFDHHAALLENVTIYGFGTGPFQYFDVNEQGSRLRVTKTDGYWNRNGSRAVSSGIDFILYSNIDGALHDFQQDEVDVIDPSYEVNLDEVETLARGVPDFVTQQVAINHQHPVFGTGLATPLGSQEPSRAAEAARYVRQAMSHAIPRDDILQSTVNGLGVKAITAWTPGSEHFDASLQSYSYDVDLSMELLAKAGYRVGENAIPPTDTGVLSDTSTHTFPLGNRFGLFAIMAIALVVVRFIVITRYY